MFRLWKSKQKERPEAKPLTSAEAEGPARTLATAAGGREGLKRRPECREEACASLRCLGNGKARLSQASHTPQSVTRRPASAGMLGGSSERKTVIQGLTEKTKSLEEPVEVEIMLYFLILPQPD